MTQGGIDRESFRIACELQIRFRKIDGEEARVFREFGLRTSPYTSLRSTFEIELNRLDAPTEMKGLLEKAFQVLLNIDQRLERIEEFVQGQQAEASTIKDSFEWVHADLSPGGIAFAPSKGVDIKEGDLLMMDMLFPSLPEQRVVCSGRVVHKGKLGAVGVQFDQIHQDDQEFIHRFVLEKEREVLRARAQERDKAKPAS